MNKALLTLAATSLLFLFSTTHTHGQQKQALRLGVYDSRAVYVAWFNSPLAESPIPALQKRMKDAKERNDSKAVAACEREGLLRQAMSHERGFGTGSIRAIMTRLATQLEQIVATEKLDLVVSKWELNYAGADVVTVDITEKIIAAIGVPEKMKNIAREMENHPPVEDAFLMED